MDLLVPEVRLLIDQPHHLLKLYVAIKIEKGGVDGDIFSLSSKEASSFLYVEPRPGRSDAGMPSRKKARHSIGRLCELGLLKPVASGRYLLPKAEFVNSVRLVASK